MISSPMEWISYAKTASVLEKEISAVDNQGQDYVLQWEMTDILSHDLADFKKDLSELAAVRLSHSELTFLKSNPEAVSSEIFLGACKPLLNNGAENADWKTIQETIKASVKQFYLADLSKFGPDAIKPLLNDLFFCVTAKKANEEDPQGFLLFSVTPALPYGDVKVINFFMKEDSSKSGLQNVLMGMIFKILPQTKRIFLFARPTDSAALEMYSSMGFERDESPFNDPSHKINHQYMISFDYKIENSKILQ